MLVVTGVYLTFWFDPSLATTTYHGGYAPLDGVADVVAYRSTVDLSLDVARADCSSARHTTGRPSCSSWRSSLHMLRVFFTGAFRKPRDLNWYLG